MTSGGDSTSAFVPVPWRSGTIVTERAGASRDSSSLSSSGSSAGQSPGTSTTRPAPCSIAWAMPIKVAGLWPSSASSTSTVAP